MLFIHLPFIVDYSPLKLFWVFYTMGAFIFHLKETLTAWNLVFSLQRSDSSQYLQALGREQDIPLLRIIALRNTRVSFVRLAIVAGFVLLGFVALHTPPPMKQQNQTTAIIGALVFIMTQTILLASAIFDYIDRHRLFAKMEAIDRKEFP